MLNAEVLVGLGRVTAFDVHPDGSWLAVEVGRANTEKNRYEPELWRVPTDGSAPSLLLAGRFGDRSPRFTADGTLLFLSKRSREDHGAEDTPEDDDLAQVWAWGPKGLTRRTDEALGVQEFKEANGSLVCLTSVLPEVPGDQQRQASQRRAKQGPSIQRYTDMPVRFWDHWRGPAVAQFALWRDDQRTDLTPDAHRLAFSDASWDLSPDGHRLVTTRQGQSRFRVPLAHLIEIDLQSGTTTVLVHQTDQGCWGPRYDLSGQRVGFTMGRIDEAGLHPSRLHLLNVANQTLREVAGHWDREPTVQAWVDAHTVLVTADDAGSVPVFAIDTRDGAVRRVAADPGSHGAPRIHRDHVYSLRSALLAPPEVVCTPLEGGASRNATSLTGLDEAALQAALVVEHEEVPSTDGRGVPVFTVRRRDRTAPGPGLMWIHGGPRGQWGQVWHWRWNAAIAALAGHVVTLPNPRGSTGLGHQFMHEIWGNSWGGQCYRDLMCVADRMEQRPDIDAKRICAMGGSFGGYMTCWIGTQTDRFACLITHAPVYAFGQFQVTTDLPAWWVLEIGTDCWQDRDTAERYSPDRYVADWESPVMIIHGEKDYRCPISESLALFEGLRRHDKQAELVVFPDENHWILKPSNIVAWYGAVLDYLDTHIGDPE